ncbi:MAG: GNAT family N-acetyltransferase [Pyrinomonadaceae bacterium]|nr:GNAT family N-acetyltransferase [Pyrinomonadaceae bacterium]
MYQLLRTDSNNNDFRELVALLDAELTVRDGDEHSFYAQFNKVDAIRNVVVIYEDDRAVGCGAFKEYESGTAEIKRMFVREDSRNRGAAAQILKELENWARESGFRDCVLETGLKQPEALHLYEKSGYEIIPNYEQYAGVENSVCMRKELDNF